VTRTVIVTGAASGLGASVASELRDNGDCPVSLDVHAPGSEIEFEVVDLADRFATERAVCAVAQHHGGIDAVVTCAGIDACGRLDDVPAPEWERVIAVNLLGTVRTVRAALPWLERVHGRVVTVASTLGLRALPDATAYCASKFGVVGFTRALAAETAGRIGVTMLVPGGMQTPFFDGRPEQYRPPIDLEMNDPANVARAVLFALDQPPNCEVRELVCCPAGETSWP
jgi:NAD(P)-dependent dehydrogenase (short-subunit alcohol dehydrogenase family)